MASDESAAAPCEDGNGSMRSRIFKGGIMALGAFVFTTAFVFWADLQLASTVTANSRPSVILLEENDIRDVVDDGGDMEIGESKTHEVVVRPPQTFFSAHQGFNSSADNDMDFRPNEISHYEDNKPGSVLRHVQSASDKSRLYERPPETPEPSRPPSAGTRTSPLPPKPSSSSRSPPMERPPMFPSPDRKFYPREKSPGFHYSHAKRLRPPPPPPRARPPPPPPPRGRPPKFRGPPRSSSFPISYPPRAKPISNMIGDRRSSFPRSFRLPRPPVPPPPGVVRHRHRPPPLPPPAPIFPRRIRNHHQGYPLPRPPPPSKHYSPYPPFDSAPPQKPYGPKLSNFNSSSHDDVPNNGRGVKTTVFNKVTKMTDSGSNRKPRAPPRVEERFYVDKNHHIPGRRRRRHGSERRYDYYGGAGGYGYSDESGYGYNGYNAQPRNDYKYDDEEEFNDEGFFNGLSDYQGYGNTNPGKSRYQESPIGHHEDDDYHDDEYDYDQGHYGRHQNNQYHQSYHYPNRHYRPATQPPINSYVPKYIPNAFSNYNHNNYHNNLYSYNDLGESPKVYEIKESYPSKGYDSTYSEEINTEHFPVTSAYGKRDRDAPTTYYSRDAKYSYNQPDSDESHEAAFGHGEEHEDGHQVIYDHNKNPNLEFEIEVEDEPSHHHRPRSNRNPTSSTHPPGGYELDLDGLNVPIAHSDHSDNDNDHRTHSYHYGRYTDDDKDEPRRADHHQYIEYRPNKHHHTSSAEIENQPPPPPPSSFSPHTELTSFEVDATSNEDDRDDINFDNFEEFPFPKPHRHSVSSIKQFEDPANNREHVQSLDDYYDDPDPRFKYNPDEFALDDSVIRDGGEWDKFFDGFRTNVDEDIEELSKTDEIYRNPEGQEDDGGEEVHVQDDGPPDGPPPHPLLPIDREDDQDHQDPRERYSDHSSERFEDHDDIGNDLHHHEDDSGELEGPHHGFEPYTRTHDDHDDDDNHGGRVEGRSGTEPRNKEESSSRRWHRHQDTSRNDAGHPSHSTKHRDIPGFDDFFARIEKNIEQEIRNEPVWTVPRHRSESLDKPADGVADVSMDLRPNVYREEDRGDPSKFNFQMPSHKELQENYQTVVSSSGPEPSLPEWSPKKLKKHQQTDNNRPTPKHRLKMPKGGRKVLRRRRY